jgi:hypothetical protein
LIKQAKITSFFKQNSIILPKLYPEGVTILPCRKSILSVETVPNPTTLESGNSEVPSASFSPLATD